MKLFLSLLIPLFFVYSVSSQAAVSKWVDISLDTGHIVFPVVVNGVETNAILDSGATLNGINTAFLAKNDIGATKNGEIEVQGLVGTVERRLYGGITVNLFGADFNFQQLAGLPLGGPEIGIIIGSTFMSNVVFQIDYPNSRMRIITKDGIDVGDFENLNFKQQRGTGRPLIRVNINDEFEPWLLLDTGSPFGVTVERDVAKSKGWLEKYEVTRTTMIDVNGQQRNMDSFRVDTLEIGPFTLESVLVNVPEEGSTANLTSQHEQSFSRLKGTRVRGILGSEVLKHFVLTLDYDAGDAHIGLEAQ